MLSKVTTRNGLDKEKKEVVITGRNKPAVSHEMLESWQSLVDMAARIVSVPSALIMRLHPTEIEVFVSSQDQNSPYKAGEKENLHHGLYCETVIGTQDELLVSDATTDPVWEKDNPDIGLGMISYLGLPLNWPDGEVFGTICLLDNKTNHYSTIFREFLQSIQKHIEDDLKRLTMDQHLLRTNEKLRTLNLQKTKLLGFISHDIRGGIGTSDNLLKLALDNYDTYDDQKIKLILKKLQVQAEQTYITLMDILLWSKAELLEPSPTKVKINLVTVIMQVLDYYEQAINQKDITIGKQFGAGQLDVLAVENMLKAVFRNLLSNAIKFSKPGGHIALNIFKRDHQVVVEIKDHGIGMDQQVIDALFTKPDDLSGSSKLEDSAGVGLLIVKDFLDKLNANIEVESAPDQGTLFRVIF